MKRRLLISAFALAVIAFTGCVSANQRAYEYMPDMYRDPAYKAFAPNEATRDGLTLQHPVPGTIPRGYHVFHYAAGDPEADRAGRELKNPYQPTGATLEEGKALFETYCLVCHGAQGKGDGPISSKIPPPPSYLDSRLMEFAPGHFFHVITMGKGKMPSYAAQLREQDRWKIVTYVYTTLQKRSEQPQTAKAGGSR